MTKRISTNWTPSPVQARLLEAAQESGNKRTITAICAEAGVSRDAFYSNIKDPYFKSAWEDIWRGSIKRHFNGVIAAQIKKAIEDGDTQAARFLADLDGLLKTSGKIEISRGVDVEVEIDIQKKLATLNDDELRQYLTLIEKMNSTDPQQS